jgi:hypothetical protein
MDHGFDEEQQFIEIPCKELDSFCDGGTFFGDSEHSLKIVHVNIRSYSKNFDTFIANLNDLKAGFDVMVLTETWLNDSFIETVLDGYNFFRTTRKANQNDGVVIYVKSELSASAVEVDLSGVFGLDLTFACGSRVFSLLAVYRTHDSDSMAFIDKLNNHYQGSGRDRTYIFLGDINLNILNDNNLLIDHYLNTMYNLGFVKCIDKPTRVSDNSSTCLDHIFVKCNDISKVEAAVVQTFITDHFPTLLNIKLHTLNNSSKKAKTFTTIDQHILMNTLQQESWNGVYCNNVNSSANRFFKVIKEAVVKSTKTITVKPRLEQLKPWITIGIVRSIRERDRLSKLLKSQPFNNALKIHFRIYRNMLCNLIKYTKHTYFREKINTSVNDPKLFWKTVNTITGKGKNKTDSLNINDFSITSKDKSDNEKYEEVADQFNKYFTNVGKQLAENITDPGCAAVVDDSVHTCDSRLTLTGVTGVEVRRYVRGLRGGSAPGYCGISATFLKDNIDIFVEPLTYIVNLSLEKGVFPDAFKIAKVVPLFKAGQKHSYNNYRPISLLSVFSKVLEKIVKDQLTKYLNDNLIFASCQYGFRRGKNVSNALFDLNRNIYESINSNKKNVLVFFDLAKAFDSVDRKKLLKKMEHIGIAGVSHDWFCSYLENRHQFVSIAGHKSQYLNVDYGVVQGSTLGPLLFIIYINNLSKININGHLYLFADDTALLVNGSSWEETYRKANADINKLKTWFDQNVLTLNILKTKYLQLSLRPVPDQPAACLKMHTCGDVYRFDCHCQHLEKVKFYKYLGVIFDSHLRWSEHVSFTKNKIRKFIYFFSQFGNIFTSLEIRSIYFAYIQSLLEGGIIAWGAAFQSILKPLLVTQKYIVRLSIKKSGRFPSDEAFRELNVLDLHQLYIKNIILHVFQNFEIFQQISHEHYTRTSKNVGIATPRSSKTFSLTNPYYVAHVIYRNLPSEIRNFESFPSKTVFKNKIDNWLKTIGRENSKFLLNSIYT